MKKLYISLAIGATLGMMATACSEKEFAGDVPGKIVLHTTVNSDVEVVSRATEEELAQQCEVWISNEKGLVRQYKGLDNIPAGPIDLLTGQYVAEAWTGDSVSASFEKRCFKGYQPFTVEAGKTATVDLVCKIANVVASVKLADGLDKYLSDVTMTVGHDRGSLIFEGADSRKGYFMMPSTSKNLTYTLEAKQIDGSPLTVTGEIVDAKPATEYVLNVIYDVKANDKGGAVLTIRVDQNEVTVGDEILIIAAPKIFGYDFDITQPLSGQQGTIGERAVYITSAARVSSVIMRSDLFTDIAALGGNDMDLLNMDQTCADAVAAAGITYRYTYNEEEDNTVVKVNFSEAYTDALTNGDHSIEITATDANGKSSTATMRIVISDAPVTTAPVDEASITLHSATLRATVNTDNVETAGFRYRTAGTGDWTSVEAAAESRSFAKGSAIVATVSDLEANTEYEYTVFAGDFTSPEVLTFKTLNGPQLPNSGFEQWSGSKPMLICDNESEMFWDSGNHGSKIIKDITTKSTAKKHSGTYSAELKTASMFGVMAAGNIFTGHFLGTEKTTKGILGWGREFTGTPKAMKAWVHYTPGSFSKDYNVAGVSIKKGEMDTGILYIALLDNTTRSYTSTENKNYGPWPVMVATQDIDNVGFRKDAANVIAYGEIVFDKATEGSDMVQVTIPLTYTREGVTPSNILVVGSASRYGDYYCGAANSTLYLDDIELVY